MSLAFSVAYKDPQLHKIGRTNSVNIMNHLTFFFLLNRLNLSKSKQQMLVILSMLALKKKKKRDLK